MKLSGILTEDNIPEVAARVRFLCRVLYPSPVLTAIQAETAQNRIFARCAGVPDDVPFPVPYKNSVRGKCEFCRGDVFIGPLVYRELRRKIRQHDDDSIFCLVCVVVLFDREEACDSIVPLSRKGTGE